MLEVANDVVIKKNMSPRPIAVSNELKATYKIVEEYNKGKTEDQKLLEPEDTEFPVLARAELPPWILPYFSAQQQADAPGGHVAAAPAAAAPPLVPQGEGAAVAPLPQPAV